MQTSDTKEVSMKPSWTVVALYEDEKCREEAVSYCDSLVARFWSTADLAVHGASVSDLEDHATFRNSAAQAAVARYLVFALRPSGEISPTVRGWVDSWL